MRYTINAIDDSPPREWNGPNGIVYYITVGLDGHQKPVSIGKKTPDALKVGDIVWGDIIPTEFETDKWKGSAPVPGTPTAVGSVQTPTKQKTDAFQKDMSNAPILMYNGSLHYAKELGLNLITDENDRRIYLEYVKDITDEMLIMVDNIRGSGDARDMTSPIPTIKEAAEVSTSQPATSLGDKFRERKQMSAEEANSFLEGMTDEEQA